jgi:glutathione S-transferase
MSALPVLVIGNKNYSSWSLRPWLAMKEAGIGFEERRIPMFRAESREAMLRHSPTGKVPCLIERGHAIWDSLAIIEYLAETHPGLWPADRLARAMARSVSAEMHSGFAQLRTHMGMNIRKRYPGRGRTPEVLAEIERVFALWADCRARYGAGGPFLFGAFCAADAMFAPVVLRFETYVVALPPVCRAYADAVLALPALREWIAAAAAETEAIAAYDDLYSEGGA